MLKKTLDKSKKKIRKGSIVQSEFVRKIYAIPEIEEISVVRSISDI